MDFFFEDCFCVLEGKKIEIGCGWVGWEEMKERKRNEEWCGGCGGYGWF